MKNGHSPGVGVEESLGGNGLRFPPMLNGPGVGVKSYPRES